MEKLHKENFKEKRIFPSNTGSKEAKRCQMKEMWTQKSPEGMKLNLGNRSEKHGSISSTPA